jgi:hypothetical protein
MIANTQQLGKSVLSSPRATWATLARQQFAYATYLFGQRRRFGLPLRTV